MKIALALAFYFIATVCWFYGEARFLKAVTDHDDWVAGLAWAALSFIAIPLFTFGTYWIYKDSESWWWVQFPYWVMSMAVSYWAFSRELGTVFSWRLVVGCVLILAAAAIVGSE
jgi:zinc transporter ZupT